MTAAEGAEEGSRERMFEPTRNNPDAAARWLPKLSARPGAALRLFCFPYAGGTTHTYRDWQALLPPSVEVCPVELPGRGARMKEPAETSIPRLIGMMAPALTPYMDRPFAFFGHSMGGLLSFELARELRRMGRPGPAHMFVSASPSPHRRRDIQRTTYDLPEPAFIDELRRLGGTPQEVLEYPELLELMISPLRADFEACQTYDYAAEPPLDCPITVLGGLEDEELGRAELEEWRRHTTSACVVRMMAGGHLFVNTARHLILRLLATELHPYVR